MKNATRGNLGPAGLLLCGATAVTASGLATAAEVSTDGGLEVASEDGLYSFGIGGRLMWDVDSFDGVLNRDNDGDRRFDTDLRRARVELSGSLGEHFGVVFDIDIDDAGSSSDAEVHTAGLIYTGWDFADVFVGRTKEPFGLEELISSKSISSIERNYFTEATDTDSQPHFGVRLDGDAGLFGWSFGIFNPAGNPETEDGGDRLAFTGRIFDAPILEEDRVLHLGAAVSDRNLDQPIEANGFRLDIAESGGELDSSSLLIEEDRQLGLEALYIQGPFSLQSEVFYRDMPGADGGPDGEVRHGYLQATWTLTGESRGYKAAQGIADIIKPAGPGGALELVAKADRIVFDVDGRQEEEVTGYLIGANYYPNRHVKLMLNLIQVDSDDVVPAAQDDDATVVSARVQVAF